MPEIRRLPIALLLLAAVVVGLGWLMNRLLDNRLAQGDVFPAYSSYRTDAFGTRALHDSLAWLAPLQVERSMLPLARVTSHPPALLFKLGTPSFFGLLDSEQRELTRLATAGGRIVIALQPVTTFDFASEAERQQEIRTQVEETARRLGIQPPDASEEESAEPSPTPDLDTDDPIARESEADPAPLDAATRQRATAADRLFAIPDWGIRLVPYNWRDAIVYTRKEGAPFAEAAPAHDWQPLPINSLMVWEVEPDSGWETLFAIDNKPVAVRKVFGSGDVILMSDPFAFSNEALWTGLQADHAAYRNADFLAWLIGGYRRVVFDEFGLGVIQTEGVGTLARRYRLHSALALLLLLVILYIWRNASSLVPPTESPSDSGETVTGHPAGAGLELLLQRAIPAGAILRVCQESWLRSAGFRSPAKLKHEMTALIDASETEPARQRHPAETYNRITALLAKRHRL